LGRKSEAQSEFSFYSFCGGSDFPEERRGRPTFGEWLGANCPALALEVIEHPTWDFQPISETTLEAIKKDVDRLLAGGRTVVIMDSGGEQRTGKVAEYLGLVEDITSPH